MSFSDSTSVGRPSASLSSGVTETNPPCQSGALTTSSTTAQTSSSGASISALALPPIFPMPLPPRYLRRADLGARAASHLRHAAPSSLSAADATERLVELVGRRGAAGERRRVGRAQAVQEEPQITAPQVGLAGGLQVGEAAEDEQHDRE